MTLNIDSYGMSRTYDNGNLVHGIDYDANYDGDELNLAMKNNQGKIIYMKMNNDEIMDIFNQPSHNKSLHQRISNDFKSKTNSKTKSKARSKSKTRSKTRSKGKTRSKTRSNKTKSKSYTRSIDKTIY